MTDVEVMTYAFLVGLIWIGTGWITYACGKASQKQDNEERQQAAIQAAVEEAMLHRKNRLRDMGRVTDEHPEASGPPSSSHGMRVIGTRPRSLDKPQTRM